MTLESTPKVSSPNTNNESGQEHSPPELFGQSGKRRQLVGALAVAMVVALLAAGYGIFHYYQQSIADANIVHVSGRIEAPETYLSAATASRVTAVTVKEGDVVHKGQLLVTLDSGTLKQQLGKSAPALAAAVNARRQTDAQVAAVKEQVSEAQARSHGFFAKIFSTKAGREKKATDMRQEMLQAEMMNMQARSAVAGVQSARAQGLTKLSYLNITSPIDGTCSVRSAEPGELVSTGRVLLTLVDPNAAYLRGFIPESDLTRVKIGQEAQVLFDTPSAKPLTGRVTSIDASPSFTPENVYFKNDRLRQAYGMKISIDHPDGLAKPGMPAHATILLTSESK